MPFSSKDFLSFIVFIKWIIHHLYDLLWLVILDDHALIPLNPDTLDILQLANLPLLRLISHLQLCNHILLNTFQFSHPLLNLYSILLLWEYLVIVELLCLRHQVLLRFVQILHYLGVCFPFLECLLVLLLDEGWTVLVYSFFYTLLLLTDFMTCYMILMIHSFEGSFNILFMFISFLNDFLSILIFFILHSLIEYLFMLMWLYFDLFNIHDKLLLLLSIVYSLLHFHLLQI